MKVKVKNNGMVFLITVFVIALLAVLTMGILQMNTEEIQLMQNQIYAAEALVTAEAGLNDAFAEIRADDDAISATVRSAQDETTVASDASSTAPWIGDIAFLTPWLGHG